MVGWVDSGGWVGNWECMSGWVDGWWWLGGCIGREGG